MFIWYYCGSRFRCESCSCYGNEFEFVVEVCSFWGSFVFLIFEGGKCYCVFYLCEWRINVC